MHSVLPSVHSDPYTSTYLEKPGIIESWAVEGKSLAQHPVHPALQDGRHAEPVQWELGKYQDKRMLWLVVVLGFVV